MGYTSDRLWGVIGQLMENLRSEKDLEAHKVLLCTVPILFLFLMLLSKCEPALLNTPPRLGTSQRMLSHKQSIPIKRPFQESNTLDQLASFTVQIMRWPMASHMETVNGYVLIETRI